MHSSFSDGRAARLLDRILHGLAAHRLPVRKPQVQRAQEHLSGWQQSWHDAPAALHPQRAFAKHLRSRARTQQHCCNRKLYTRCMSGKKHCARQDSRQRVSRHQAMQDHCLMHIRVYFTRTDARQALTRDNRVWEVRLSTPPKTKELAAMRQHEKHTRRLCESS